MQIGEVVEYRNQQVRVIGLRMTAAGQVIAVFVTRSNGYRRWVKAPEELARIKRAERC